ncbi:MAG: zinc-binding dehydrogenase [Anaerolineaceae bacterium]|nr:zinc-binding dehydrogenase [Anaerolineaceae bacterium]
MPTTYQSLPATMRAVQVMAPGRAEFIETPLPDLQPGHALVRTRLLSLCGSDFQWLHHFDPDDYPMAPGTTGHEVLGEVVAHDAPGHDLPPGRLALTLIPDHTGMAEYCLVKARDVLYLPPEVPPAHLLQAQQFGTVIYACKQLPNVIGQDVVVIGQGSAGLWFDLMLRRMGARRVIAIDLQAHRLQAGRLYGATDTIHNAVDDPVAAVAALSEGRMADIVIEAAGEVESVNLAVALTRRDGFLLNFGAPRASSMPFPMKGYFYKNLTMRAAVGATRDPANSSTRQALHMIASGEVDAGPLITHSFPFDQVLEAYELQGARDEGAIKILIDMQNANHS